MKQDELHAWRWRSFERILHHVCDSIKPKKILEWGPGHSTVVMLRASLNASVLTIEHSSKFHEIAAKRFGNDSRVELAYRPISMKGGHSVGYVNYPLWRNIKEHGQVKPEYDIVFVDGRFRFDCLTSAWNLVKPTGVVLLHDAHRENYLPAVNLFKHHVVFDEMRTAVMSHSPLKFLDSFDAEKQIPDMVVGDRETLEETSVRLASGNPFTYLRFGDADLYFMVNPSFDKNRRHDPDPAMSKELAIAFSIEHPDYILGCSSAGGWDDGKLERLGRISSRFGEGRRYYSAVALQCCYEHNPDRFVRFVKDAFWGRRVLLIGGESVCRSALVKKSLGVTATIEFTDRNAYKMLDAKMAQIQKNMSKFDVIISALGQCTRVLGYRLWQQGLRTQYFDIGSVIDALADRPLRSWIQKQPKELLEHYKKAFSK